VPAVNPLDATSILAATGLVGVFCVLVAETGLLVGFFLPGDSLLFAAGLLAATSGPSGLPLGWLLVVAAAGALLGAQIGYVIGRRGGPAVLSRIRRPAVHRGVARAGEVMDRYGPAKAIVLARFIPIVRTVMNPMAGVLAVPPRVFVPAQVAGGLGWTIGVILAGYWPGSRIPGIDTYLLPIIAVIVLLSLIPVALEIRRVRRGAAGRTRTDWAG
jgi:membrane-associated protein